MQQTDEDLTRSRFAQVLEVHGADPTRWPVEVRTRAQALVARDRAAARQLAEAEALDRLLDMAPPTAAASPSLIDRIVAEARREPAVQASNVIALPRPARPLPSRSAGSGAAGAARPGLVKSGAGWRLGSRQLAGGGGMLAAALLVGLWLGAAGVGPTVDGLQQAHRSGTADLDALSELVQAVLPIELLEETSEDHL